LKTRQMRTLTIVALAAFLACGTAVAAFPDKTITIVVPTTAGGANDAMARIVGQAMSAILKQPVIVENKAGANGAIASEFVMRAAPDGYTLMLGYIATHAMNPAMQKLRYDPIKDFEPVGMIGSSATVMVLNPAVKAGSAKEVVAMLKAAPDKVNYASAGNGTAPHFAAEMFKLSTGTSMLHVPYKGSAPAIADTIGGQTQVMFPSVFTAVPYVKAGKLTAVGIAGPRSRPAGLRPVNGAPSPARCTRTRVSKKNRSASSFAWGLNSRTESVCSKAFRISGSSFS